MSDFRKIRRALPSWNTRFEIRSFAILPVKHLRSRILKQKIPAFRRSLVPDLMIIYAIWYHLYNLKNVKNTHEGVLYLAKLQASLQLYSKKYLSMGVFTFFDLCKWYQIAQSTSYMVLVSLNWPWNSLQSLNSIFDSFHHFS